MRLQIKFTSTMMNTLFADDKCFTECVNENEDALLMDLYRMLSLRTTGPKIGLFVLALMHFTC